jgi:hypothetical protein
MELFLHSILTSSDSPLQFIRAGDILPYYPLGNETLLPKWRHPDLGEIMFPAQTY